MQVVFKLSGRLTRQVEMSKRAAPPGSLREFPMATVNFAL
jgi:hypothetical protein